LDAPEHAGDGFLHEVVSFGQIAGPCWKPPGGPTPQARQQPRGNGVQRELVAIACACQQRHRRLGAEIRHQDVWKATGIIADRRAAS
jgi:predicted dienelactone hydrolase